MSGSSRLGIALIVILLAWVAVYYRQCGAEVMNAIDEGSVRMASDEAVSSAPDEPPAPTETPDPGAGNEAVDGDRGVEPAVEEDDPVSTEDEADRSEEAPTLPEPPQTTPYTVVSGDTMERIAERWFGDARKWVLIAQENPFVDPMRLKSGATLRLPPKDARLEDIPPDALAELMKEVRYVVASGDTLSAISRRFYGDPNLWRTIFDANRDQLPSANDLRPGMELLIPPHQIPADGG
ncbi:MAG: LysM peptidoglycan-binding domain-containing protein [Phycisphaerales bacterium]